MKTQYNAGDKGFAIKDNAIIGLVVADVQAHESLTTPESVINTTDTGDTFNDAQIFNTPEEVGQALVAAWYAANPPVPVAVDATPAE